MRLHGELDIASFPDLTLLLRGISAEERDAWTIVDLRPVTFMDSTAIRELRTALDNCHRVGHGLRLVYDQPFISRLLALHGATGQFPRYASTDDAWAGRKALPKH
ncbi:STAS domain-containing protein [Streptomyces sp. NPDC050264]|uniref:STAS domain-containing protein n=1 Tax=Streptomyces sp. NPDC050264 TaxID=3155038 RepID=UPI00342EDC7C